MLRPALLLPPKRLSTPRFDRGPLDPSRGSATRRSGSYMDGTHARWSGGTFRTHHGRRLTETRVTRMSRRCRARNVPDQLRASGHSAISLLLYPALTYASVDEVADAVGSRDVTSLGLFTVGVGGRSMALVIGTLNLIVLARALGPVGRGQYFVFVSLLLVLTTLADLGISQSAVVFGGRYEVRIGEIHRILVRYAALFALLVFVVGTLVILAAGDALLPNIPREWSFVALVTLPLAVYASYWSAMMIGLRQVVSVTGVQLAAATLSLAGNVGFVAPSGSAVSAVLVYVAVLALQAAAMFWLQHRMVAGANEPPKDPRGLGRDMLLFGLRGYPNSLGMLLWSRSAVFVLNVFHGPGAVGAYSVAQALAERILLPIQSLQDLVYNRMTHLPPAEATQTMNRYLRIGIALMVPIVATGILVSPMLVTLLFSEAFDAAATPLRVLLVGSAVMVIPVLLSTYMLGQRGRPGLLSILSLLNGCINLLLLFVLVPGRAETGAAIAALTAQVVGIAVVLALYLRTARTEWNAALVLKRADLALVKQQILEMIAPRSAR